MKLYMLALLTLSCVGEAFAASGCDNSSDGDSDSEYASHNLQLQTS